MSNNVVSIDAYRLCRPGSNPILSSMLVECPLCVRPTSPRFGGTASEVRYRCEGMVIHGPVEHDTLEWTMPADKVYENRA